MTELKADVAVLGAGPGGYAAAFRAADLGKKVILIECKEIGGVCLNVGCIPSKTLLHLTKIIEEAALIKAHGITFASPKINLEEIRSWKNTVIKRLTTGLRGLAKRRKVEIVTGIGKFISPHQIEVKTAQDTQDKILVNFEQAIIAAGSSPMSLPFIPNDARIMDSTAALELPDIAEEILVIGGGVIGLEMASVYHVLGSKISVVEFMDQLLPGVDKDIVKPLHQVLAKKYNKIMLNTKVTNVRAQADGLWVSFTDKGNNNLPEQRFDRILLAIGRKPNGNEIGAQNAGINVDQRGFISVDNKQRTNIGHIYAIGDIVGNPMLAHKAAAEGRLTAEIIAGFAKERLFKFSDVPGVVYTDPEVATVGLSENELIKQGIKYGKGVFPWAANGRSLSLNRQEGLTKLLFDASSHCILGAAIVGPNAGDLISEVALAIKMKCTAEDIASTIHPHPTLSETIAMAAEVFEGTATDL